MSNKLTTLCRPLQMSATQKAVLMCLADFAHDDGRDWHSIAAIVAWTCLGKTAVIEALKWLEAQGLIVVDRRVGTRNQTVLQADRIREQAKASTSPPRAPVDQQDQSATRTGSLAKPVRHANGSAKRTSPPDDDHQSAMRTPTSPPGEQTGTPGEPEALKASVDASEKHHSLAARQLFDDAQLTPGSADADPAGKGGVSDRSPKRSKPEGKTNATWLAFSAEQESRYGVAPLRNAKVNGQLARLLQQVPVDEAPDLARFYVRHAGTRYVNAMHDLGLLLRDVQALRTQMLSGRKAPEGLPMNEWQRQRVAEAARRREFLGPAASRDGSPTGFVDVNYTELPP